MHQSASNAVDEQPKLRTTWAGIWQPEASGPVVVSLEDGERLFHRPSTDATRGLLSSFRAVTELVAE